MTTYDDLAALIRAEYEYDKRSPDRYPTEHALAERLMERFTIMQAREPGPRDGIPVTERDLHNLDRWSREDGHDDTLAGYVPKLLDEVDRLAALLVRTKEGAKHLGHLVHELNMDVLHATGLHHLIGGDGDGDWQGVYECLAEMRPPAQSLRTLDDLKVLPRRSIVLDANDVTYRLDPWHVDRTATWYPFDGWDAFHRDFGVDVDDIALPATLLHEGEK
ncbi:hypothetical protein [Rhodococcoides fascians]|uniref:hypothetical protein n=1 Tax=Rhodococcoides fascians TaxID=1828 RepID=UPI0005678EB8|nr:hypothetical protein [Rhodococcus fascians]